MTENSRTKNSIKNIFFGLINRFVMMFFPFFVKTIMIKQLGAEYLGLNNLFSSILQVLSLSELGIGTAMVFSMYKPMAEKNYELLCALLNLYKKVFRLIGLIILILGLSLMPFLKYFISGTIPKDINIYILYFIYLINTVLSYLLFAYKKSLLEANQNNSVESKLNTIVSICLYTAQIIAILVSKNYYVYAILIPVSTLLLNIYRSIIVDRLFPNVNCSGSVDKSIQNEIKRKVGALIGHKIGTTVITSADSIVISSFLGLQALAIYSNYYYILSSLIGLITIFYNATTASIGNSLLVDSIEKNYNDFKKFNFANVWLVSWCTICLVCLYQPFMKIWMGSELMLPFSMVALFALYFYTWLSRRIGLTYKDAAGLWEQDLIKPYLGAIVNIISNIYLVNTIGIEGVLISTIFVMVFIYFPWETKVLFSKLFPHGIKEYCIKQCFFAIVTFGVCFITYNICSNFNMGGIFELMIKMGICIIIPNILFILVYFKLNEFKEIVIMVNRFIKRS